jgi:hypothetical protein
MVGLRVERDSIWQEHDDARGWINDLLGEVEKEMELKLKSEDVSIGLTMEVALDKAKIHALETEVSRQNGEIDKLQSGVKGEPSTPMSFFVLDPRCLSNTIGIMVWASLEYNLVEEVVKSHDLGDSL